MPAADPIPRYYLYGEAPEDVERSFLHVESIERRSSVHDWTIRLHAHPEHHQILVLTSGGGTVQMEESLIAFRAYSLIVMPALVAHAYRFEPGSNGWVVTVSTSFLRHAVEGDADLSAAFASGGSCIQNDVAAAPGLAEAFETLQREFVWSAPGRRIAIKASLQRILVTIARLQAAQAPAAGGVSRRAADIVIRFRELVERDFRGQADLAVFARALGVTTASLNASCRAMTGKSALTVVHDRVVIEAKRQLLYTGMSVGEVAESLGFADPAYFNRFFSQRAGTTPGRFRAAGPG